LPWNELCLNSGICRKLVNRYNCHGLHCGATKQVY